MAKLVAGVARLECSSQYQSRPVPLVPVELEHLMQRHVGHPHGVCGGGDAVWHHKQACSTPALCDAQRAWIDMHHQWVPVHTCVISPIHVCVHVECINIPRVRAAVNDDHLLVMPPLGIIVVVVVSQDSGDPGELPECAKLRGWVRDWGGSELYSFLREDNGVGQWRIYLHTDKK